MDPKATVEIPTNNELRLQVRWSLAAMSELEDLVCEEFGFKTLSDFGQQAMGSNGDGLTIKRMVRAIRCGLAHLGAKRPSAEELLACIEAPDGYTSIFPVYFQAMALALGGRKAADEVGKKVAEEMETAAESTSPGS